MHSTIFDDRALNRTSKRWYKESTVKLKADEGTATVVRLAQKRILDSLSDGNEVGRRGKKQRVAQVPRCASNSVIICIISFGSVDECLVVYTGNSINFGKLNILQFRAPKLL